MEDTLCPTGPVSFTRHLAAPAWEPRKVLSLGSGNTSSDQEVLGGPENRHREAPTGHGSASPTLHLAGLARELHSAPAGALVEPGEQSVPE